MSDSTAPPPTSPDLGSPPSSRWSQVELLDAEAFYGHLLGDVRARGFAPGELVIVGVQTGGAWIAERLHADLGVQAPLGLLSIAFHRDDYSTRGVPTVLHATQIQGSVDDQHLLLVDDILYTGRTIRAALNEIFDFGRPASISLAVLVDRGGRELPMQADFVGGRVDLAADERVKLTRDGDTRLQLARERLREP